MFSKKISALAASALLLASGAAVAQTTPSSAGALSTRGALMQTDIDDDDDDGILGLSTGAVVGVIFGIIVLAAIIFGTDDERDTPASP